MVLKTLRTNWVQGQNKREITVLLLHGLKSSEVDPDLLFKTMVRKFQGPIKFIYPMLCELHIIDELLIHD